MPEKILKISIITICLLMLIVMVVAAVFPASRNICGPLGTLLFLFMMSFMASEMLFPRQLSKPIKFKKSEWTVVFVLGFLVVICTVVVISFFLIGTISY